MITSARAKQSLEYEFGLRHFTPEDTYYLGLSSTDPALSITEPDAASGYSRVEIINSSESWSEVAEGEYYVQNSEEIAFPILIGDGGTVSYWFLSTSDIEATCIYYGKLDVGRPMPINSQVILRSGDMKIYRRNAVDGE